MLSMVFTSVSIMAQAPKMGKTPLKVSGNSHRRYVGCKEFNKEAENNRADLKPIKADTLKVLPKNFPTAPFGATTCGCYTSDFAAYYVSPQSAKEIFSYYTQKLQAQGYLVPGIEGTNNPDDFQIRFKNKDGQGYIYVYGDKYAYKIFYEPVGKSCNCPGH